MPTKTLTLLLAALLISCSRDPSSDEIQQAQQERLLQEGTSAIGMPAIKNFRERRILKDILEMRDQDGLVTYTYLFSEVTGKLIFLCESIGYGIPYATQYTNPSKVVSGRLAGRLYQDVIPQADPNGLFSPSAADGTWVLCKNPKGGEVKPLLVEPRTVFSPFRLDADGGPVQAAEAKP
jgi:hypothetical protein